MFGKLKCKKCNKTINGVTLLYGGNWLCSNCAEDRESVLFCEKGCKVKAAHFDCGTKSDKEKVKKFLKQDGVYEVESLEIDGFSSDIYLKEVPDVRFNTVHFVRYHNNNI